MSLFGSPSFASTNSRDSLALSGLRASVARKVFWSLGTSRTRERGSNTYPVGVRVNVTSLEDTLDKAWEKLSAGEGFTLFTLNLDHFVKMRKNVTFCSAYQQADFVTADGWPVVWLANRMGQELQRTCGSDLVEPICKVAATHDLPVFFVGPSPSSQSAAISKLKSRYPNLQVAGRTCNKVAASPTSNDVADLAALINASGARICFLSLGAPKQELLADALSPHCPDVGFFCVGAALDFISGEVTRAPATWRKAKLEWAWRLMSDPRRLATRYAHCAVEFFRLALAPIPLASRP